MLDATIIESWKKEAQLTYQGTHGYQPMRALWAEMDLVVADEFRDGNVPAQMQPLPVTKRAFQALPETVKEFYLRGDSGCWEKELLHWRRDARRADGPPGPITFGISGRMTPNLKKYILRLWENLWKSYRKDAEGDSDGADVWNYWPQEEDRPEGRAVALHRHSLRQAARGVIGRRQRGPEFRGGGHPPVGLGPGAPAGMAGGRPARWKRCMMC